MMSLSALCIRRPVMTILLCLSLVVGGLLALTRLPIAALPSFDTPTINVSASLPGASPQTMASSVATPLEKQFATIPGVNIITSSSSQGSTSVTLEFAQGRDIDAAAVDVQAALLRVQRSLPADMTSLPAYRKVNPADSPILLLSVNSPSLALTELNAYAENLISPSLTTMNGVAQVQIFGQKRYAVRIKPDPQRLAARNLTLDELASAVRAANVNTPMGSLEGPSQVLTIQSHDSLRNAADFAKLAVAQRNGSVVRLADVATVEDSVENLKTASWVNGERAIVLAVFRQSDGNTVAVVDAIRAALPKLEGQLPASVRITPLNDRAESIREAVRDVQMHLLLTVALVVMVIFMFLQRAAATIIPALSLPVSIIATLALMYFLGFSLNNISLLGLTLAVGLVVDDAVVVLENIVRYREQGMSALDAALRGSREVVFTILSISLSLVAIFIPIFYMGGVIGLLFHEFAVVVTMAVLVSALVSLTLIPMLAARFLGNDTGHASHGNALGRVFERGFAAVLALYERTLDWALLWRRTTLLVALLTFAGSAWLFMAIPKGFFPDEDLGQLAVITDAGPDVAYTRLSALHLRATDIVRANPNVASVTSSLGGDGGRMFVTLKPRGQRLPTADVVADLRRQLGRVTGLSSFVNPQQSLRLGGRSSKSRYQYVMQGVDADELYAAAAKMQQAMRAEPIFTDVNSDAQLNGLQASVQVDRERAAQLGVSEQAIRSSIYAAFGQREVSTIYTSANNYAVLMQVDDAYRRDENALNLLSVRSSSGELVPLPSLIKVGRTAGPVSVNHQGQLPAVTLSFNLAAGAVLGEADITLKRLAGEAGLPASIFTSYGGDAAAFAQSQGSQILLLVIAVLVIYVLLGVLYESFIHPLTILAGLPSAAIGALGALMLMGQALTVIASIGILMLIGIVKKNAIMMIDFALAAQREQQLSPYEAIRSACLLRLRPILMTTLAAMAGALPIALGLGAGAELRQPLGIAVMGGLVFSQLITLYITPVLFLWLDKLSTRTRRIAMH